MNLKSVLLAMEAAGAERFYAKPLAPNDNSKNQIYLGGDFSALNVLPHGEVVSDESSTAGSKRSRAKAIVEFYWIDEDGRHSAPNAQLILYPRYPEVRLSGILSGSMRAPRQIINSRDEGRVLFFGICKNNHILGYAAGKEDIAAKEVLSRSDWSRAGVFVQIGTAQATETDTRHLLLTRLRSIRDLGWIDSQRLTSSGESIKYVARNAGGFTLEAMLGIVPNSYSEPDFLGWEVKQYGVRNFVAYTAKSLVTLMTPEPNGGLYYEEGVVQFVRRYGYPDQRGIVDRLNFGGAYAVSKPANHLTGLRLEMIGYDTTNQRIVDFEGAVALVDKNDFVAASWTLKGLLNHWSRKHEMAVYVPSIRRAEPPSYAYGSQVILCNGADFGRFIQGLAKGRIIYDPGIKLVSASSESPTSKRRSPFRVRVDGLGLLYKQHANVDLD